MNKQKFRRNVIGGALIVGASATAVTVHANPDAPRVRCDDNWGPCQGTWSAGYGFGPGGKCKKYTGTQQQICRTVMANNHTANHTPGVRACSYTGQCDNTPPTGTAGYTLENGILYVEVKTCVDTQSGCNEASFTRFPYDPADPSREVTFCDFVGNCATAPPPPDGLGPNVTVTIDWSDRVLQYDIRCVDNLTFCDVRNRLNGGPENDGPGFVFNELYDLNNPVRVFEVCDYAGNCTTVQAPFDITPPVGDVSFHRPFNADGDPIWHSEDEFPELQCRLVSCVDPVVGTAPEESSGCLSVYENGKDYPNGTIYNDPGGARATIEIVTDPLEPVHLDTCTIQVCDNAGNCAEFTSPPIYMDNQEVCTANTGAGKTADGACGDCAEDDDDCLCIKGDESKCRDNGPINCYTNPFHDNCPGFTNIGCLLDPISTPGCPRLNPCYPTRLNGAECPIDAVRFCARNPFHYSCNLGGRDGTIDCNPGHPTGEIPSGYFDNYNSGAGGFGGL